MRRKAFTLMGISFLMLFVLLSCTKEDTIVSPDDVDSENKYIKIPYTVVVNRKSPSKVEYDSGYKFSSDDWLYIVSLHDADKEPLETAGKAFGYLHLTSAAGENTGTFSGTLYVEEEFEMYDALPMRAYLISPSDKIHTIDWSGTEPNITVDANKIPVTSYPTTTNSIAPDFATAVSWYSDFTDEKTYGTPEYSLKQGTAFIVIGVTFNAASNVPSGKSVNITFRTSPSAISNNRSASVVTTTSSGNVIATGVTGVPGGSIVLDYDNLSVSWDTDGEAGDDVYKRYSFSSSAAGTLLTANRRYTFNRIVKDDYFNDLFTIENSTASPVTLTFREPDSPYRSHGDGIIQKSTDGINWETIIENKEGWSDASIILTAAGTSGDKVHLRGTFACYASNTGQGNVIRMTGACYAYGDMMYLVGSKVGDTFQKGTNLGAEAFNRFFYNNTYLRSKDGRDGESELVKLEIGTSGGNFSINQSSCKQMFNGCSQITMAPELWAVSVDLKTEPNSHTSGNNDYETIGGKKYYYTETAYSQMFLSCGNLEFAPMIALTHPYYNTFGDMFKSCPKLRYIQCLASLKPLSNFSPNWVSGVASSGLFIYNKELDNPTSWWGSGANGIPSGWTLISSE